MQTQTRKIMRCSMCMTKKNESLIRFIFDCVFYIMILHLYLRSVLDYPKKTLYENSKKATLCIEDQANEMQNIKPLLFAQSVMVGLVSYFVVVVERFLFRFLFLLFFGFYFGIGLAFGINSHVFVLCKSVMASPES